MITAESKLGTLLANVKKAVRDKETVTIGGGEFNADELQELLKLESAARTALYALQWTWGGEPLPSLELQAINELKALMPYA